MKNVLQRISTMTNCSKPLLLQRPSTLLLMFTRPSGFLKLQQPPFFSWSFLRFYDDLLLPPDPFAWPSAPSWSSSQGSPSSSSSYSSSSASSYSSLSLLLNSIFSAISFSLASSSSKALSKYEAYTAIIKLRMTKEPNTTQDTKKMSYIVVCSASRTMYIISVQPSSVII